MSEERKSEQKKRMENKTKMHAHCTYYNQKNASRNRIEQRK